MIQSLLRVSDGTFTEMEKPPDTVTAPGDVSIFSDMVTSESVTASTHVMTSGDVSSSGNESTSGDVGSSGNVSKSEDVSVPRYVPTTGHETSPISKAEIQEDNVMLKGIVVYSCTVDREIYTCK